MQIEPFGINLQRPLWLFSFMHWRYIDDGIGIWTGSNAQWLAFQQWINSFGTLRWTFTKPSRKIDYLNLTIRLDSTMMIQTSLLLRETL
jgi:hypothetical protein